MEYSNGDVYEGEWLEGLKHGYGKMTYKYTTSHEKGKVTKRSTVYEGLWEQGKKQGRGTLTAIEITNGRWANDDIAA